MEEIEITSGINGYPKNLRRGYIGFDSFEQAEEFAKKCNGTVCQLKKRDGWQFWEYQGKAFSELEVSEDDYGDDYRTFSSREEYEDDCRAVLTAMIADDAPMDDIIAEVANMKEVLEKIDRLGENESVLLCRGNFVEVIKTKTMRFSEDVWTYAIGVDVELKGI